jgi:hypothetical protein
MDGTTLLRDLRQVLSEGSGSAWLDTKSSYDHLYNAAIATVSRTDMLTTTQAITTVANDSTYNLNADFLKLYMVDDRNDFFIKYYDGSSTTFIYSSSYQSIYLANNTTSVSIPHRFAITDSSAVANITGTASAAGNATNGECTLTDSTAPFANVSAGDYVHNTTDGSNGIVLAITSTSAIVTALFDGTENDWDQNDAYVIIPQARFQLVLDPPPLTAGHIVTVPYVYKPAPVFSNYRSYKIPNGYKSALVKYAAWEYKYRDREPNFGDAFYKYWDNEVRKLGKGINDAQNRKGYGVNFIKRGSRTGTFR